MEGYIYAYFVNVDQICDNITKQKVEIHKFLYNWNVILEKKLTCSCYSRYENSAKVILHWQKQIHKKFEKPSFMEINPRENISG